MGIYLSDLGIANAATLTKRFLIKIARLRVGNSSKISAPVARKMLNKRSLQSGLFTVGLRPVRTGQLSKSLLGHLNSDWIQNTACGRAVMGILEYLLNWGLSICCSDGYFCAESQNMNRENSNRTEKKFEKYLKSI